MGCSVQNLKNTVAIAAICTGISFTFSGAASAEVVDELIVTAQKREENILEVPIAITTFGEEQLDGRGFSQIEDLAFAIPNVSIQNSADSRTTTFTIRGITGQTLFPGTSSATGIFVDGVYINNPIAQSFEILDTERIEVLRGPQGTLYGRNTTAGAINLISKKPELDNMAGKAMVEAGDYQLFRAKATISGPLVEGKVGASLAVAAKKRDGYERNTFLDKDVNTDDNWSVRGALRWLIGDATEINIAADYLSEDRAPGVLEGTPEDRELAIDVDIFEKREVFGGHITVDHDLTDTIALTSITGYRDYDFDRLGDDDGTASVAFTSPVTESTAQFSQELRLASTGNSALEWVVGLYYLHTDMDGTSTPFIDPDALFLIRSGGFLDCPTTLALGGTPPAAIPALCATGTGDNAINQKTDTYAAFGQASYSFTDRLSATVGLRYSIDEKDFSNVQSSVSLPLFLAFIPPGTVDISRKDEEIAPKLSLEFAATDTLNLYATIARGFNAGGFNTAPAAPGGGVPDAYEPETLTNFELGAKWASASGRFRVSTAAFYLDYKDFQAFRNVEVAPGIFTPIIDNAEEASSIGIEIEALAQLTDYLSYSGSVGYADAQYDSYSNCGVSATVPAVPFNCDGNQLANSPDWTANSAFNLAYPLPNVESLVVLGSAEWSYRGDVFYSVENDPESKQDGFSLFNASVGLGSTEGDWSLVLWGQNLGDKDYTIIAVDGLTSKVRQLGAPRTWGVRLNANF